MADNDSIENAPSGIRLKMGGVRPWHLSFRASVEGHTHLDMLQQAGWTIDSDGSIFKDAFFIHSDGRLSMGSDQDVIKLEAQHPTHRLWIGSTYPDTADFSVSKAGRMVARSGEIAGWDILSDRLSKNGAELLASGELSLGTGDNKVVISASNLDGWRLWAGAAVPTSAPFRVNAGGEVWMEGAHFSGEAGSANYQSGSKGWHIGNDGKAEFNDVIIRGLLQSVVFAQSTTSVMAARTIITDGGALIPRRGNLLGL